MNDLRECCQLLENLLKEDKFNFKRLSDSEFKIWIEDSEYTVFIYWYSISENQLGVSLRNECDTNLYDYVCACQGIPMGAIKDRSAKGIASKVMTDLCDLRNGLNYEKD